MSGTLHVVGAGMAGLACAVTAARAGSRVVLHEASAHAGGRCRSFHDERLGRVVDNGTHLVLGANRATMAYCKAVGGHEAMEAAPAAFPFVDLAQGARWVVEPGRPPARLDELARALGLPWTGEDTTVAARLGRTRSYARLWRPLCEAILDTAPAEASARLFARVLRKVLLGGRPAMTPWRFPAGLDAAFVAPALATLAMFGAKLRLQHRLLAASDGSLVFEGDSVTLGPEDRVVLALPPWVAAQLLPGDIPALATGTIVSAHFRVEWMLPQGHFLGVVGAVAQWLSWRGDVLSVTVSAADRLAILPNDEIAALLWADAARALELPPALPPFRVLKERRATLVHTPDALRRRPGSTTRFSHLFLAGDWIASPWPCTIEAAVSSGLHAARLALSRPSLTF